MFNKTDLIGVIGFIFTVMGFFLIPFLIGIPIMLVGWLIIIYATFKRCVDLIIPKAVQTKAMEETIKSYEPYKPAINSLLGLVWEMVKIASLVILTVAVTIFAVKLIGPI